MEEKKPYIMTEKKFYELVQQDYLSLMNNKDLKMVKMQETYSSDLAAIGGAIMAKPTRLYIPLIGRLQHIVLFYQDKTIAGKMFTFSNKNSLILSLKGEDAILNKLVNDVSCFQADKEKKISIRQMMRYLYILSTPFCVIGICYSVLLKNMSAFLFCIAFFLLTSLSHSLTKKVG